MRPNQLPIQWTLGSIIAGIKRSGHQVNHLPQSSVEVVKGWSCNSTLSICLHGVYWDKFAFINHFQKTVFWDVSAQFGYLVQTLQKKLPSPLLEHNSYYCIRLLALRSS
jgi:hypothetical protein